MIALSAVLDEPKKYPMVTDRLTQFAGPQCYPHLDPSSVDYRVLANQRPKGEEEEGEDGAQERECNTRRVAPDAKSAVLSEDNWLQCDRCAKWRCVSGSCVASLRGDDFFHVKDTDMDWECWLAGAEARYNLISEASHGDQGEDVCPRGGDECVEAGRVAEASLEASLSAAEARRAGEEKEQLEVAGGVSKVKGVQRRLRRLKAKTSEPDALAKAGGVQTEKDGVTSEGAHNQRGANSRTSLWDEGFPK